ncbi:phenylacetate--CoA ligase family protein [Methanosphaera cuniculi]|uniref:Phenylacetate--CoA ligase n=1 Tax=Methanosphaera cuniculi TaxID=1077256 RepID=A0A2A2HCS6_9EURY|nr:phenylacetate--CoA ligase [Methanosphaera cuniculi]PAV07086.1 phenylacetate--CoA ligase [Methanosphaera cuniculi]PWL08217.1 phenylacetate-coenzyme A ligase [Methanosphaera cuniculi]
MIWDKDIECLTHEEMQELQLKRLQDVVTRAFNEVPYYHERYSQAEVYPEDIQTLDDIEKLPFTTKTDLRASYPFGLFAVPQKEIVEIHTSSGTTGKPTVSGYTKEDLDIWGEVVARGLTMMGVGENDIIQNTHGYGLFTGGFGVHYGGQKIGATVIPISTGQTLRQIELMQDFNTSMLIFTPSYGLHLAEVMKEKGVDPKDLNLKVIGFGSEAWTDEMREKIEEKFGVPAYNIYGLTEVIGPGVAMECPEQNGLHIYEDHFYPEIIDPKTHKQLPEGKNGELVLTALTRVGMPLIRFRTKDITNIRHETCGCGRTLVKMDKISGRTDDMLKIKGVSVFPSQIEKALLSIKGVEPHYQIILTRPDILDEIEIKVEASPEIFFDNVKELIGIRDKLAQAIHDEIGLRVNVTLVEPKTIDRVESGKAKRVIDNRGK